MTKYSSFRCTSYGRLELFANNFQVLSISGFKYRRIVSGSSHDFFCLSSRYGPVDIQILDFHWFSELGVGGNDCSILVILPDRVLLNNFCNPCCASVLHHPSFVLFSYFSTSPISVDAMAFVCGIVEPV